MKNVRSKEEIEAMLKGLEMQREYLWITGENQQQFDALNVSIDILNWVLNKKKQ